MIYLLPVILACTLLYALPASADCITDQYGNVLCGEGQCVTNLYGKVYCAEIGGGAIKDSYGEVQCGVGYCAKDNLGNVWCSKVQGGGAAVDSNGTVKCLRGCEIASPKLCVEGF